METNPLKVTADLGVDTFAVPALCPDGYANRPNQLMRVESMVGRRDPLSEIQQRMVSTAISLIHSADSFDPQKTEYKMEIGAFLDACGFSRENIHGNLTREIEKISRKGAWLYDETGRKLIRTPWFQSIVYTDGEITFEFAEKILPLIIRLAPSDAEYHLVKGLHYKGKHTLAVFEIIWSWRGKGVIEYSIPQLMQQLSLEHTRYSYGQLKLRVLEPSFEEIYLWDDALFVHFGPTFSGRRVEGVWFEVTVGEAARELRKKTPEFKVALPEEKPTNMQ